VNLYWEIDERRFVAGLSDPRVVELFEMPAGDVVPVRIYMVERSSIADPFSTVVLAAADEIVVSAKATAANAESLLYEDEFEEITVGAYTYYSGELDLNTKEIGAAIGGQRTLTVLFEVALNRIADDTQRYSTAVRLRLVNNIINVSTFPTTASENVKFVNNVLHIRNETTGDWHPMVAQGADGQEHINLGEGA